MIGRIARITSNVVMVAAVLASGVFYGIASYGGTPVHRENHYRWDGSARILLVFDSPEPFAEMCVIKPDNGEDKSVVAPASYGGGIQSTWRSAWFEGSATVDCSGGRVFTGATAFLARNYAGVLIVIPPIIGVRYLLYMRRMNRAGALDGNFIGLNMNR